MSGHDANEDPLHGWFSDVPDDYQQMIFGFWEPQDILVAEQLNKFFFRWCSKSWNKEEYRSRAYLSRFSDVHHGLRHAASRGCIWQVKHILANFPESLDVLDASENAGYTQFGAFPLMEASRAQQFEVCKILLDHRAPVNQQDHNARTCLMMACMHGSMEILHLLLDRGADLHLSTHFGQQPLHYACLPAKPDIVEILISAKADPKGKMYSATPLHRALSGLGQLPESMVHAPSREGDEIPWVCSDHPRGYLQYTPEGDLLIRRTVAILLRNGAHPGYVDDHHRTGAQICLELGRADFAKWMEEFVDFVEHSGRADDDSMSTPVSTMGE